MIGVPRQLNWAKHLDHYQKFLLYEISPDLYETIENTKI